VKVWDEIVGFLEVYVKGFVVISKKKICENEILNLKVVVRNPV
jgi:hypothetical protein